MVTLALAIASGAGAVFVACFTVWLTVPLRRLEFEKIIDELEECRSDRHALRRRLEVLQQTLMGLLPEHKRLTMLEALDALTPPFDTPAV